MSIHQCPVCRKTFDALYPDLWAYKRGGTSNIQFFCSWGCLRENDKKKGENRTMRGATMITPEMEKEAVRIAIEGGNPRDYLASCGSKNPSAKWSLIRAKLKDHDPETYGKLPGRVMNKPTAGDAMAAAKEAADTFFGQCEDMGLKLETPETPEKPKITKPVNYDGLEVSAVRDPNLGEFYYDHDHNCIDWRNGLGDEVSLPISGWKIMVDRLAKILQALGVDA